MEKCRTYAGGSYQRYQEAAFVINLKTFYEIMAECQVPFISRLVHVNTTEGIRPFAVLSPKGMVYKPRLLEQLIKALYSALSALKVPVARHRHLVNNCAFYYLFIVSKSYVVTFGRMC